ncbi:MAG: glycosyltransferase [Acidobacteriota bacterium]
MTLCIPIPHRPEGGMYTFLGNFRAYLERAGVGHTVDLDGEYDTLFVNSWVVPYRTVSRVKRARPDLRVVQRVDGAAQDYGRPEVSDWQQARVNLLADLTIFQSRYSRYSTREKFTVIAQDGPIIYNPVDVELFQPEGPRADLPPGVPRVACASWSTNRAKGTWLIDRIAAEHPDTCFVLCGRFKDVQPRANVARLGHLSRRDLAAALRACDVFLNLSENDPCPNVVLEALASGLPVLFRDSGGVPELVGDCGKAVTPETFAVALTEVMIDRDRLARAARERAVQRFGPEVIFPQYLAAMETATRRRGPVGCGRLRLAAAGYPVLPRVKSPRDLVGSIARRVPRVLGALTRASSPEGRVGWVTYDSFPGRKRRFSELDSFTGMRVGNVATWLNRHDRRLRHELYDPQREYQVVVFQKAMDARCQDEAAKIRAAGGKVVFDANVNYYEVWGDYFVPGTAPTELQQHDARRMTTMADWVVADSAYLHALITPINPKATWIPDNVDRRLYRGVRSHAPGPLRLVWSGIGKKAAHLLIIVNVLAALREATLTLVVDEPPDCLADLERAIRCRVVPFSNRQYARTLLESDVIISPKRLVNGYEMAHTEYKIALGMAVGLPAVASPQPSYVDAIGHLHGGVIAADHQAWHEAFERLRNPAVRAEMGDRARRTVAERYDTAVVAARYGGLLSDLAGLSPVHAAARS